MARERWKLALLLLVVVDMSASSKPAGADDGDDARQFSDWSAPTNLGPVLNTGSGELAPCISKDGRSLYFFSDRPGGFGGNDIWVSQRARRSDPWGSPQNIGPTINTSGDENAPTLSVDGHWLYFASSRPGGFGGLDLYVSRRHSKRDDFGWSPAENLGSGVNTASDEAAPMPFESDDDDTITLYFHSNRLGSDDIYASTLAVEGEGDTFSPAVLVEELSSPFQDRIPSIRRDGLEMFLASNRPGTIGLLDLWVSTRACTSDAWSMPVNLGPVVNTAAIEGRAALSFDGTTMYLHSTRPGGFGGFDLYISTRNKLKDEESNDGGR